MKSHQQRIATGVVLATLPLLAIVFQGWVLFAILLVFAALTLWEFYTMFPAGPMTVYKVLGVIATALLMGAALRGDMPQAATVLAGAFWIGGLIFLLRFGKNTGTTFNQAMIFLAGLLYIPLNFQFLLRFNRLDLILIILAAAVSDTAAFYAGTLWGKRKIWPSVSPKKSWAGSLGGMAACVAVTTALGLCLGDAPAWAWPLLGAALNLGAQFGDFFESALKRTLGVKDSGTMLPGHGGFLDRVDSLLLVIPVYALAHALHPFFG